MLVIGPTSFVYGPDGLPISKITSSSTTYFQHDQAGSTRLLDDSTGAVTGTYTYGAYGQTASHTGTATTSMGYAGQWQDSETGFYYLRNRYYDPQTAQFITADPLGNLTHSPYNYVANDPLNGTDPMGLWPSWADWSNFINNASMVTTTLALIPGLDVVFGPIAVLTDAAAFLTNSYNFYQDLNNPCVSVGQTISDLFSAGASFFGMAGAAKAFMALREASQAFDLIKEARAFGEIGTEYSVGLWRTYFAARGAAIDASEMSRNISLTGLGVSVWTTLITDVYGKRDPYGTFWRSALAW
jgi:RHS repeat-associated protein